MKLTECCRTLEERGLVIGIDYNKKNVVIVRDVIHVFGIKNLNKPTGRNTINKISGLRLGRMIALV